MLLRYANEFSEEAFEQMRILKIIQKSNVNGVRKLLENSKKKKNKKNIV